MLGRFPRGDDADDFFFLLFVHCVCNQQNDHPTDHPHGLLPLFPILHPVHMTQGKRISKHFARQLEADVMIPLVVLVLFFIPRKPHLPTPHSVYTEEYIQKDGESIFLSLNVRSATFGEALIGDWQSAGLINASDKVGWAKAERCPPA